MTTMGRSSSRPWRSLLLASACALAACSDAETARPRPSSSAQAIVNGTSSTEAQDYVVQIAIEKNGKMIPHCTGTLVAKDLVITARHCVGELSEDEESITDFEPSKLKFYFGTDAGPKTVDQAPEAEGKKLFTNGNESLVPDIAVIQLDRQVDLPIAPIRLASGAVKGESVDVVGYGLTENHAYPNVRQQRKGLKIAKVGPGSTTHFDLTEGEFQIAEAACAGDSGGPALSSETGALVGIASRVSNGQPRDDTELASFCMGSATEDIYTDLVPARAFIEAAFEAAGATPRLEGEPSADEKAAEDAEAQGEQGAGATSPPPAADEGCSVARAPSRSGRPAALSATALALVALRARRRVRALPWPAATRGE
jgi:secreted trypsin-like serine protease